MATASQSVPTTKPDDNKPLYFTKDGKLQFGVTPPAAFAFSYPYPPLPSNLGKNRVLRAIDDQTKESLQEGITEAEKEFEKEAMPLPTLAIHGSPLPKLLIPEIELAIYWDRHPYEYRPDTEKDKHASRQTGDKVHAGGGDSIKRTKSEMNLKSKVGEPSNISLSGSDKSGATRRSSATLSRGSRLSARSATSSVKSLVHEELSKPKNNHSEEQSVDNSATKTCAQNHHNHHNASNNCDKVKSPKGSGSGSGSSSGSNKSVHSVQMGENERKKFEDIKSNQNERQNHDGIEYTRPKLVRPQGFLKNNRKSTGVQVTLDEVVASALKSTYLCPLHGQYRRGVERRDKSGFRTDMSSTHVNCSRALQGRPSRTKLIKTAETQTEDDALDHINTAAFDSKAKRSKTAGHGHPRTARRGKDLMASEYHGSFRDPYKIADSEKRHLRNKILNYCFTKHSIF